MKNNLFIESMEYVDKELIEESYDLSAYVQTHKINKWISFAACFCICAVMAIIVGFDNSELFERIKSSENVKQEVENSKAISTVKSSYYSDESILYKDDVTESHANTANSQEGNSNSTSSILGNNNSAHGEGDSFTTTVAKPEMKNDAGVSFGASSDSVMIPVVPKNNVKITGEKITDNEAKNFFESNKTGIFSALESSGVSVDNIRIVDKGYSHLLYDGTTTDYIELRQNFRDYIVFNGDELVAIITLYKENGIIYSAPAFGSPAYKNYSNFLNRYKGQKLVYVYAGNLEIIITPDNKAYNILGVDVSVYLEGVKNPYDYFYNESAVYIP